VQSVKSPRLGFHRGDCSLERFDQVMGFGDADFFRPPEMVIDSRLRGHRAKVVRDVRGKDFQARRLSKSTAAIRAFASGFGEVNVQAHSGVSSFSAGPTIPTIAMNAISIAALSH